jgi:hypothetical protein
MIIDQNYISWQSLILWNECRFKNRNESRNKNKNKNKNRVERKIRRVNDDELREILIRNAEIREVESINEQIEIIWLKEDVFVYKQRVSLFDICRFKIQRNQKFDWFLVNFRSFDFDCLDSNNLSSLREFNNSLTRDGLKIRECEVFVWEHNDQFALEFRDWWNELRENVE